MPHQNTVIDRCATLVPAPDQSPSSVRAFDVCDLSPTDLETQQNEQPNYIQPQEEEETPYVEFNSKPLTRLNPQPTYNIATTSIPENLNQPYKTVNTISYAPKTASQIERAQLPPAVISSQHTYLYEIQQQTDHEMRADLLGLCERTENALAGGNWHTLQNIHHEKMVAFVPDLPISLVKLERPETRRSVEAIYKLDRSGKYGVQKARVTIIPPISTKLMGCDSDTGWKVDALARFFQFF